MKIEIARGVKVLILTAVLILLTLSFFKIKSLITEDLIVEIRPTALSLNVKNGQNFKIALNNYVKKPVLCRTECEYSLKEVGTGRIIDASKLNISAQSFLREYSLSINKNYEGQEIFIFKLSCANIKEWFCPTEGIPRTKSAIITVNHELSYDQSSKKNLTESILSTASAQINSCDEALSESQAVLHSLTQVLPADCIELNELQKRISYDKNLSDNLKAELEAAVKAYDSYDWDLAEGSAMQAYLEVGALINESQACSEYARSIFNSYNFSVYTAEVLKGALAEDIPQIEAYAESFNRSALEEEASKLSNLSAEYYLIISGKNYSSINELNLTSWALMSRYAELMSQFQSAVKEDALKLSVEARYNYLIASQFGYETSNPSQLSWAFENSSVDLIKKICLDITSIQDFITQHNQNATSKISAQNISEEVLNASSRYSEYALWNAFENMTRESNELGIYQTIKPLIYTYENISNFSLPEGWTWEGISEITKIITTPEFESASKIKCASLQQNSMLNPNYLAIENLSIARAPNLNISFTPWQLTLSKTYPLCCANNTCSRCCPSPECSSKPYPIILLHGHLSYEKNSPELTINSFSAMQQKLEELGYINAGLINMDENIPQGEWGRNPNPVSVRASYYYISYYNLGVQAVEVRKTDSIENYAIRLKEIVEEVKRRTGSDKVVIIAHSMGGLVAREYISIFGDESVDKLVTIGTPNYGIEGALVTLCPIFGSKKECEDMTKDSIFLKRLNAPQNIPKHARIYTISAVGCETYGKDGDGVIIAENVVLPFAKNYRIRGICTSAIKRDLHSTMIQPSLHPETFEIIKEILNDNSSWNPGPELIER
ncbi:MAG: alpha/beta fold hydrolase [Candidatus Woesearchaeota archaeon]